MKRSSTPTSSSIPLSTSPVRTTFYTPKDKATISVGETVARSPIVAHQSKSSTKRKKRDSWGMKEDDLLGDLVKAYPRGHPHWKGIADDLNMTLGSCRNGKQCRERWRNHLRPNIKKGGWTVQEEQMIHKMYKTFGPKWTVMSQYMKNRTDNDIKNKWYSMYRSASVQQQKTSPVSHLTYTTGQHCSQSNEVTNGTNWTTQPDGSAAFPPPFSLTPITTGRKPETNKLNPAPSEDLEPIADAVMSFSYSWGDLSF